MAEQIAKDKGRQEQFDNLLLLFVGASSSVLAADETQALEKLVTEELLAARLPDSRESTKNLIRGKACRANRSPF